MTRLAVKPAAVFLAVEGTLPPDATLIHDENGCASVRMADGRIFEPFLGWAVRETPPVHGEPPTAILADDEDDIVIPDANHHPIPVGTRPDGFSFNTYALQRIEVAS